MRFVALSLLLGQLVPTSGCGARRTARTVDAGADADTDVDGDADTDTDTGDGEPCDAGPDDLDPCYTGPDGTLGVGLCREGRRQCLDGLWTECSLDVIPWFEVCNGLDDDCNGIVDDGIVDECGRCDPDAEGVKRCLGRGCVRGFDPDVLEPEVGLTCDDACCDCLVLEEGARIGFFQVMFPACDDRRGGCTYERSGARIWTELELDVTLPAGSSMWFDMRGSDFRERVPMEPWQSGEVDDDGSRVRVPWGYAHTDYLEVLVGFDGTDDGGPTLCRLEAIVETLL